MAKQKCNHTIFNKDCKSCVELQKKWYKKLDKDEFEDIEQDEYKLKRWSSKVYLGANKSSPRSQAEIDATTAYYQMATNFLNDYKFQSELERVIWEYHANGLGVRDIASILIKAKVLKFGRAANRKFKNAKLLNQKNSGRTPITNLIRRLREKMFKLYSVIGTHSEQ